jgi:hypothetical protein
VVTLDTSENGGETWTQRYQFSTPTSAALHMRWWGTYDGGPFTIDRPRIVGGAGLATATEATATAVLEGQGLVVATDTEYSSSIAEGLVTRTSPAAGTIVEDGSTVVVWLSSGFIPVYAGGVAFAPDGTMEVIFLDDETEVPSGAVFIGGIAHSQDGTRYVANWPASDVAFYNGGRALRSDGALIVTSSGTQAGYYGGIALTYRGETMVSTDTPELIHNGVGLLQTGELCVSEVS